LGDTINELGETPRHLGLCGIAVEDPQLDAEMGLDGRIEHGIGV
jgi:hypothetical protein